MLWAPRLRRRIRSWCCLLSRMRFSIPRCTATTVRLHFLVRAATSLVVIDVIARAGDLGVAIKGMVDDFQVASKSNQKISTIADMQRFVENYPEFRAKSGNVSKHVTLLGELSRLIDERHLMQVSQVEQV